MAALLQIAASRPDRRAIWRSAVAEVGSRESRPGSLEEIGLGEEFVDHASTELTQLFEPAAVEISQLVVVEP